MRIYTRQGDTGETGLIGGRRVRKHVPRIDAYGTVDELNALLGVARASGAPSRVDQVLDHVQNELFDVGAELADPIPSGAIGEALIQRLEEMIDLFETELEPLKQFILPGGTQPAAHLHLARTVCRRAERKVVELVSDPNEKVDPQIVVYLNRLSDLLFVLARVCNAHGGVADAKWMGR
jgi:cob(I)alamin adenosyltransferase